MPVFTLALDDDFVNREQQLAILWRVIHQETVQRVLLLTGPNGIGKTRLMRECWEQCEASDIDCVFIDLADDLPDGYLSLVQYIWQQLGRESFEAMEHAYEQATTLGRWEAHDRPGHVGEVVAAPSAAAPRQAPTMIKATLGDIGDDAQVAIGDEITMMRNVTLIVRRDDAFVQGRVQILITQALRDCLVQRAAQRPLVFFLDTWCRKTPTTDVSNWLTSGLLTWLSKGQLARIVAIIACEDDSDPALLSRPLAQLPLEALADDAIRAYWTTKRSLPAAEVEDVIKYSGGLPLLMVMMAKQRALALGRAGRKQ